jgi:hypothetical protein
VQLWSAISAFVFEPPRAVHVDFESADLKAPKEIFPGLQGRKLVPAHRSFQLYVKSLLVRVYVRPDRVVEYFEILSANKPEARVREIDKFEHYFETIYFGLKCGSHGRKGLLGNLIQFGISSTGP